MQLCGQCKPGSWVTLSSPLYEHEGFPDKVPPTEWPNHQEYYLTAVEARCLMPRCQLNHTPVQALGEDPSLPTPLHPLLQLLVAPWLMMVSLQPSHNILHVSLSVSSCRVLRIMILITLDLRATHLASCVCTRSWGKAVSQILNDHLQSSEFIGLYKSKDVPFSWP